MNQSLITQSPTSRGLPAEKLGELPRRFSVLARHRGLQCDAIERAVARAEVDVVGSAGVLITYRCLRSGARPCASERRRCCAGARAIPDEWDALLRKRHETVGMA